MSGWRWPGSSSGSGLRSIVGKLELGCKELNVNLQMQAANAEMLSGGTLSNIEVAEEVT
jgi:hypothetical protein